MNQHPHSIYEENFPSIPDPPLKFVQLPQPAVMHSNALRRLLSFIAQYWGSEY